MHGDLPCDMCPYGKPDRQRGRFCKVRAATEAHTILVTMLPRLLDLEDLRELYFANKAVYAESKKPIPGAPKVFPIVLDYTPVYGSYEKALVAIYGRNMTLAESDYNVTWRAWTNEPDEKQMEEAAWPEKSK